MIRRVAIAVVLFVAGFVALAFLLTLEGAAALVFGWAVFLWRTLPRVTADGPSVAVGLGAVVLFAVGLHLFARGWYRGWRFHWSFAAVVGVLLLFAAGVAVVGVTHQIGWLATSREPVFVEAPRWAGWRHDRHHDGLGWAVADHVSNHGKLPAGGTFTFRGEQLHSWETALLPYLHIDSREIDLSRPWTDPKHAEPFRTVVPAFLNPVYRTPPLRDADGRGLSHFAANVRVMGPGRAMRPDQIIDGAATTILIGDVNAGFRPWGDPVNWRDPADGLGGTARTFGGPGRYTMFVMADGSVRSVTTDISPAVLRALATPAGGEAVGEP